MKFIKGRLSGTYIIEPEVFADSRGFFLETYSKREFEKAGINLEFVQDNLSRSVKNTVRGLHYQINHPQDKLVRAVSGEIFDVAVDIRRNSPTFGQWEGCFLSAENKRQFFIPKGFAHGFCVVSDTADFMYKCSNFYSPKDERGIIWNDPGIGVEWPLDGEPILSKRDLANPMLKDAERHF
ncbi:MAG: dTDP-4-dehydrorhamnose 3,5-epimerase [Victivallales bacterium]|jgi:dTDP-4-dehydrorhamnose 3,5-epimerase